MKKIPVQQKSGVVYALVDDSSYEELLKYRWRITGNGYAAYFKWIKEKKNVRPFYMHRIVAGTPHGMETDHINHDKLDNRSENLRICTPSQNKGNLRLSKKNTSGLKGVCWDSTNNKWLVNIWSKNKQLNLGRFKSKEEAANVYNIKAKELFGDFALLNRV